MTWEPGPGVVELLDGARLRAVGCRGRTGTALACIAQLAGVPADQAIAWVRRHYDHRAVETPWQRAYVRRFRGAGP